MAKRTLNNIKMGLFVLAGLAFLIILLYMIGKNRNLFGDTYQLKARFENVQGLVVGNNVRFAGIQAGTVIKIDILNDTAIEVSMIIDTEMQSIIRKNALASISTDGLVGNKVVNIVPSGLPGPLATEGDILVAKKAVATEEMLQILNNTNNDIAFIVDNLKTTAQRINNSTALWGILNDKSIPNDLSISVANIRSATGNAGNMINDLQAIVADIKKGEGSIGVLLKDSSFAMNLNQAVLKMKTVADEADSLMNEITIIVSGVQKDLKTGKGPANALLRDSSIMIKINATLDNIQNGTDGFNQNMEALKHNILFRGYFRKLEKAKTKKSK
jgi:phospholipid/cholesterol/gamma-HCH transport system substrate-binding protein